MATERTSTYAFQTVQATINGLPVEGWADGDDVCSVSRNSSQSTLKVGAGGSSVISVSADRGAMITIRVWSTSLAHKRLMDLLNIQNANPRSRFPFTVKNTITNEGGAADLCKIGEAPAPSLGNEETAREWVLVTGEWQDNVIRETF